jgi:hypothetical protein
MIAKLAIGIVLTIAILWVGTHPETREFAKVDNVMALPAEKMSTNPSPKEKPLTEPLSASTETVTEVEPELVQPSIPITPPISTPENTNPVKTSPLDNETIIWNRLISEGYTREQTAGIMGNLQQEHNFKTDDHPNGLGIAQWMGGRRAALMARGDYLNINVQLDHLIHELNTTEASAKASIVASGLEGATIAFQNKFERCNPAYCHLNQRLNYAYAILDRH